MEIERTRLASLSAQGYFVTVFSGDTETLVIDCDMYFTDTDETGGPASPLCLGPGDARRDSNLRCVGCDQLPQNTGTSWSKGSILCPVCGMWTQPYTLKQRHFRGVFKLVTGGPAQILDPPSEKGGHTWMTNEEMIQTISAALNLNNEV
jgi:hypothetical protein